MKRLGYVSKADAVRLLSLLEDEGLKATMRFDKEFADLFKKSFPINPPIRRRSSYHLPEMGWYVEYKDDDEDAIHRVVLDSSFAFLLQENTEKNTEENTEGDPFSEDEESDPVPDQVTRVSRARTTFFWIMMALIVGSLILGYVAKLLHRR